MEVSKKETLDGSGPSPGHTPTGGHVVSRKEPRLGNQGKVISLSGPLLFLWSWAISPGCCEDWNDSVTSQRAELTVRIPCACPFLPVPLCGDEWHWMCAQQAWPEASSTPLCSLRNIHQILIGFVVGRIMTPQRCPHLDPQNLWIHLLPFLVKELFWMWHRTMRGRLPQAIWVGPI